MAILNQSNPQNRVSRRGLCVLLFLRDLWREGKKGSTYAGLKDALNYEDSAVRKAVRELRAKGMVSVVYTGAGQGTKAVIYLKEEVQQ
jgi:predicted transcriptional regulator